LQVIGFSISGEIEARAAGFQLKIGNRKSPILYVADRLGGSLR
jgi:hypothetical protein